VPAVKNSSEMVYVGRTAFHAVVVPPRGMSTRDDTNFSLLTKSLLQLVFRRNDMLGTPRSRAAPGTQLEEAPWPSDREPGRRRVRVEEGVAESYGRLDELPSVSSMRVACSST
jgi:hypothetical protein